VRRLRRERFDDLEKALEGDGFMTATAARSIVVERTLPYPPERIWRALTESALIGQWLMPNDFEPVVGRRFTFQAKPMGGWNGVVHCEVLDVEPPRRLRYTWIGGSDANPGCGSRIESDVTWTLTPAEGGTPMRMEHDGFRPENASAYDAMRPGWARVLERIEHLIATFDQPGWH
jgi:uncharacterized protein YndB with AHSA1/START domain